MKHSLEGVGGILRLDCGPHLLAIPFDKILFVSVELTTSVYQVYFHIIDREKPEGWAFEEKEEVEKVLDLWAEARGCPVREILP